MRYLAGTIAALVATFALAAASEPPPAPAKAAAETSEKVVISQKGKVFDRAELKVKRGESVVFRNDDPVTHNVFSRTKGNQFNLKMQKPGQEDVVTFEEPGEVTVRCAIHPTMKLTVHVEED